MQDASKTRRTEHLDGSVLIVHEQEARKFDAVLRRRFIVFYFLRATTRCIGNPNSTHLRSYSVMIFHAGLPFSCRL